MRTEPKFTDESRLRETCENNNYFKAPCSIEGLQFHKLQLLPLQVVSELGHYRFESDLGLQIATSRKLLNTNGLGGRDPFFLIATDRDQVESQESLKIFHAMVLAKCAIDFDNISHSRHNQLPEIFSFSSHQ